MRVVLPVAVLLLCMHPVTAGVGIDWQRGPDMPAARDHLGCGILDGSLVIAGGAYWKDEVKHYSAETIACRPHERRWVRLPRLPKPGAYGASAALRGPAGDDCLLIAGGADERGATTSCLMLARAKGAYQWKRLPDLPFALAGAGGAIVGAHFLVVGGAPGMDETGIRAASPSLLELDVSVGASVNRRWKTLSVPRDFTARVGAGTVAIGDALFVFGGYGVRPDGTLGNFADAWSVRNGKWTRLADMPIPTRWMTAIALDSRHIGLFGGYGDVPTKRFLSDAFIYDTRLGTYTRSTSLPTPIVNMAGGITGGTIYLAGGEDRERHRTAETVNGRWSMVGGE